MLDARILAARLEAAVAEVTAAGLPDLGLPDPLKAVSQLRAGVRPEVLAAFAPFAEEMLMAHDARCCRLLRPSEMPGLYLH